MLCDLVEAFAQEKELPRVKSIGSQAVAERVHADFKGDECPAL
jgi:hypothetical protein